MNDQDQTTLHDVKVRTASDDVFVLRSPYKQPRDARGRFTAKLIDSQNIEKEIDYAPSKDGVLRAMDKDLAQFDVVAIEPDDAKVTGRFVVSLFERMRAIAADRKAGMGQDDALLLDQPAPPESAPATSFDVRIGVDGQDDVIPAGLFHRHADGTLSSEPEIVKEPSLASKFVARVKRVGNAVASSPVGDIAYILFKTDDVKVTSNKVKSFFSRKQDDADTADTEESKPSLLRRIGNVVKTLPQSIPAAGRTIAKEWKTIGTTAAIVGGTRWGLTALAGMAGAPVLASLAAVTATCGTIAGSLKTHAAYRKEKQRLLALDARHATTSFSNPEQIATTTLSFREFMEQNKGLLSSNIAKSMAAATVGSAIGYFAHNVPNLFNGHSSATDQLVDTTASDTSDLSSADRATIAQASPSAPAAAPVVPAPAPVVDFAAAPLAQKLDMVRGSIQGEPSAYITNRLTEAANGKAQAMKDVARALYAGEHGVPVDQARALNLYEEAAAKGNRQAIRDLAYIRSLPQAQGAPVTSPVPQADPAPVARVAPRVVPRVAPSSVDTAVTPRRGGGLPDNFLDGVVPENPTDNAAELPPVALKPTTIIGYNVAGFDPNGDSMAQCFNLSETCESAQNMTAEGNERVRFQDGTVAVDAQMEKGETLSGFLSRQFGRWGTIRGQLDMLKTSVSSGQAIAPEDVGAGNKLTLATGQTVVGRDALPTDMNVQFADASTAVNDNANALTALNDNNEATTGGARRFARFVSALGIK